jgi:hypothetical protein
MPKVTEQIKKLASLDRIAFKKHGLIRLHQRNLAVDDIKAALMNAEVIESYSGNNSLPAFLILGYTKINRPLHVVLALDEEQEMVWIITVYEPNLMDWEVGFRKRRKV